ncbi:MAG TPA: RsmE family RNA methyltransferase [Verrucomicrobiae bacterium]|jgi:16S rRNA (uracil1498-N3)-methyltransferase
MSSHRFYLPPAHCNANTFSLSDGEAHHALKVLRLKAGDPAIVLDGAGHEFICQVDNTVRDSVSLRVIKQNSHPAPACAITLLVGVPKGKIIESIIQKSVELGARKIVPLLTERVVTQLDDEGVESKREKWQQVAIEAIKQCGATWLPEVTAPISIADFLNKEESFDMQLVGSLQPERRHPTAIFHEFGQAVGHHPKSIAVWVGPEGDFTPAELETIQKSGAQAITLGNLTLRVETAAIYCLSILNYELNIGPAP